MQNIQSFASLKIFFVCLTFLLILEYYAKPYAINGIYFQRWSSNDMMQALPIEELQKNPLKSLWYLHKQAPGFDLIRATVAQIYRNVTDPAELLVKVDSTLYVIWAIFYALQCTIIFIWMSKTTNIRIAQISTTLWAIYPGTIASATLLEITLLSSVLTLWFFYELWNLSKNPQQSIFRLAAASILMYFVRSFYQWYFFPFVILSLILAKIPAKSIYKYCLICILVILPYITKQLLLFGTIDSSSIAGYHYCGVMWHTPSQNEISAAQTQIVFNYPDQAKQTQDRFNTEKQYKDNLIFKKICKEYALKNPLQVLRKVFASMKMNYTSFINPVTSYQSNVIINLIPWVEIFNFFTSGIIYLIFIYIAIIHWLNNLIVKNKGNAVIRNTVAILIPFLYTLFFIGVSNRYSWHETSRLRFILDPLLFIFIITECSQLICKVVSKKK